MARKRGTSSLILALHTAASFTNSATLRAFIFSITFALCASTVLRLMPSSWAIADRAPRIGYNCKYREEPVAEARRRRGRRISHERRSILKAKGADVVTVSSDTKISAVAGTMKDRVIGALVVTGDDAQLLGIISERDIVHGLVERGRDLVDARVGDLMTVDVLTCAPEDRITKLMARMTERRIRHLPVVEDGALCGIVSIGDVVKNRLDEIEAEASALREYVTTA